MLSCNLQDLIPIQPQFFGLELCPRALWGVRDAPQKALVRTENASLKKPWCPLFQNPGYASAKMSKG